jgi:hypothetical protein
MKSIKAIATVGIISVFWASCSVCKPNKNLQVETLKITEVSKYQANIYSDIVIDVPAKKVWATLTDFNKMPTWSSTLKGLSGEIKNGGNVIVKFDLGNGTVLDIQRSPLLYAEGEFFGWSGEIRFKGLTDNHKYRVVAISKCQTRFIQTEEFTGENPDITPIALANMSIERYRIFNKELKKEVEKN